MYNKINYNNNYNKENYKRCSLIVKKEDFESIENHYKSKGFTSLNSYIKYLIDKDMNS